MRKLKSPPTPRIGGSIFRVLGATKLKRPKRVSSYAMTPNDSDDEEEQAEALVVFAKLILMMIILFYCPKLD